MVHLIYACSRPKAAFPCSYQTLVLRVVNTNKIRQHMLSSSGRFAVVAELSLGTVEVSHTEYQSYCDTKYITVAKNETLQE